MVTNLLFVIGSFVIAVLLGMMVIPNILLISYKKKLFDMPDARKVHTIPVPRLGGISFFPVILISVCLTMGLRYFFGFQLENLQPDETLYEFLFLAVGCMMLYLIGVMDDLVGVGYRNKFVVQIVTACLLVFCGDWFNTLDGLFGIYALPAWFGKPFTVLIIVFVTNAINLIDGIDGLASGLSCIALAVLSSMFIYRQEYIYAMLALATLGVLIPFWFYNVFGNAMKGHKLFMGDAGSMTLGYVLSFLVIRLSKIDTGDGTNYSSDMIMAFSTLLIPLLDVVRVVLHRLRHGNNPFLPDKNHFHHKLQRTGMRLRVILVTILVISLLFICLNALLVNKINVTLLLGLDVVLWTLMQLVINWRIRIRELNDPTTRN